MIVMTAGTGGTLAGIARKFKEKVPNCKVFLYLCRIQNGKKVVTNVNRLDCGC